MFMTLRPVHRKYIEFEWLIIDYKEIIKLFIISDISY
jgi:hypothetical protein